MRPADGFWGVAERVALLGGNEAAAKIKERFPVFTMVRPNVAVIEHRRADCTMQTAYLFDLAADWFVSSSFRETAENLIGYLVNRSGLRNCSKSDERCGLWGWAAPIRMDAYWTDDNSWVATILMLLANRKRPELRDLGLQTAKGLYCYVKPYLDNLSEKGLDTEIEEEEPRVAGIKLNPHWIGLVTMALAHASKTDDTLPYAQLAEQYYALVLGGPPAVDKMYRDVAQNGLKWSLSEYAYLALTASICARQFKSELIRNVARTAANALVNNQQSDGHWAAQHIESPAAANLSDLIYTDNWAALGLYHAWLLFDHDSKYRQSLDRLFGFLADIQDRDPDPVFRGCWRGMYDTNIGTWGGGDRYEGGANSIYTGWTNAPVALSFLLDASGETLFA